MYLLVFCSLAALILVFGELPVLKNALNLSPLFRFAPVILATVAASVGHRTLLKNKESRPAQFINAAMAVQVVKMLTHALALVIGALAAKPNSAPFLVYYAAVYIIFLVAEQIMIGRELKN